LPDTAFLLAVRRRVPGKSNAQRPAIAQSIEFPTMGRSGATPEAWHWQPHHFQSRRDLWHAMLLEADTESVSLNPESPFSMSRHCSGVLEGEVMQ
jgi:hypothetical protein